MVAAGKPRDEADGRESQPASDNHTECNDVHAAVTRNNYGRQSLFTLCNYHWPSYCVDDHSIQISIFVKPVNRSLVLMVIR